MPELSRLVELLKDTRICVLTGAGCSTGSGIPDYRGPETARRARNPIDFNAFVSDPAKRRRYWARSTVGWLRIEQALPNDCHLALAALEHGGRVNGVLTQNVDSLHTRAGSRRVVELHGSLADVYCLSCGLVEPRKALQARLDEVNPGWVAQQSADLGIAPDGDAELDEDGFQAVDCARCGGPLKPDVVFFGENLPAGRLERARAVLNEAEALLVVGTSLTVFSGYRFVREAHRRGMPIGLVNLGPTRGDALADVVVDAPAGPVLRGLVRALLQVGPSPSVLDG